MTKSQFKKIKSKLPGNWRTLLQKIYQDSGKNVKLQRLTDLSSGKIKDAEAVEEFIQNINALRKQTQRKKQRILKML